MSNAHVRLVQCQTAAELFNELSPTARDDGVVRAVREQQSLLN